MHEEHRRGQLAAAVAAIAMRPGSFSSNGEQGARPEVLIHHRRAKLSSGIGAPSLGKPAQPDPEKSRMRQEAKALGMSGKQYRAYLKTLRQSTTSEVSA